MKHVLACLSAREDRESSFHHRGSPVRLVQDRLCAGKTWENLFTWCCEARVGLFKCQGRQRKQFSLLWKSCAARASLLMCGKDLITPFYPRGGAVKYV